MTTDTLKITYGQRDELREAGRERLQRALDGETGDAVEQDDRFVLDFESYADVAQLMRTANLELLEAIVEGEPASISEAARAVSRDYKEVHRNLTELEDLGVVEFEQDGASKKPVLRGGAKTIDFSLQFPGDVGGDRTGASA
ncbi:HVO_A0114 family putative DNA-binding protein [Halolamina salifodinae]|uniref:Putative transcriptional regulator n=1 Tax=Halolamina salifodinae TaxID=1202767 RepID=A0A8T4GV94_9EURY|nr:transcriptional regulator [Halolamina salifodinae]MBP1985614.1 putative transcriptional regulator [Halolamina salifodinae]